MALQGLLATPGAGPGCLLHSALFCSTAVTNKGMEEESGIFLCEGAGLPNHDLKSWRGCPWALSSFGPFTSHWSETIVYVLPAASHARSHQNTNALNKDPGGAPPCQPLSGIGK